MNEMKETITAVLHEQHSLTRAKAHASTSYTAMESADEVTFESVIWECLTKLSDSGRLDRAPSPPHVMQSDGIDYLKSIK